ncbi:MAG: hypothetical protein K9M49_03115 [Candidatus Marinimicrobia bacterium]|nr:hypothetical protein [Candidatus Neomarinimicrobiota bacterium]MCF7850550.1 hypothetical protein [Candidatus Neomarinimicrobiota bacterium]MCF7904124.1 hypothetical protein [Candidatus Neomarinimicrobiota bacterium]
MRYLVLFILAYFAYKGVKRFFANFQIVDKDSDQIGGVNSDANHGLHVNEDDIEDAEFKDLE